jgi:DNA mismatch repair protein MutS2
MVKKAQQMISGAKVSTEYIFDRLDKLQKEKDSKDFGKMYADAKKDLRNRLNEADDIYNPIEKIDDDYVLPRPLVKGDTVILKNLGTEGVLLDNPDKQGNVNVKSGIAKTKTNISNLILVTEKNTDKKKDKPQSRTRAVVSKDFSISIDVRGKNVEEAWIDIDKYFDEALYSGIKSVTVVHGKGTGLLRKGLWEFFRKDQRVKKYRHGEFGEGDFGVTIVEFK